MLEVLLVMALVAVAAWVVTRPLRRPDGARRADARMEALEAAKEAKYREIRDAELDHATGKLTDEDWRALDAQLRSEAVELLRRIDARREAAGDGEDPPT
jgi:type II secretory pathway pseudopilin PulG